MERGIGGQVFREFNIDDEQGDGDSEDGVAEEHDPFQFEFHFQGGMLGRGLRRILVLVLMLGTIMFLGHSISSV